MHMPYKKDLVFSMQTVVSIYLYAHMPLCPYAYMPICLYAYMSICLYAYMPICLYAYLLAILTGMPAARTCSFTCVCVYVYLLVHGMYKVVYSTTSMT
jgi:hypothetical protein